MTISLNLSAEAERRLAEVAQRLNIPLNELAAAALQELLAQPAEDFERVAHRLLEKNRDLYRRLA